MKIEFPALTKQLQAHLQANGINTSSIHLLAHGESNLIFQVAEDTLARVAITTPNRRFDQDPRRVTHFEARILNYLQDTDLTHQLKSAQLAPTPDFAYTYLLTNYLPGDPLTYSRNQLASCAETLAQLHRLPIHHRPIEGLSPTLKPIEEPLTLFFQESQAYAQPYLDSPQADPQIVSMVEEILAKASTRLKLQDQLIRFPHYCLVHSDLAWGNWLITTGSEGKARLIDWEWAEISTPAGDLGHFLSPITISRYQHYRIPTSDRDFFLQTYFAALKSEALAERIRLHLAIFGAFPALRSLCWTVGYWVTASQWYQEAEASSRSMMQAENLRQNQSQFGSWWQEIMAMFEAQA